MSDIKAKLYIDGVEVDGFIGVEYRPERKYLEQLTISDRTKCLFLEQENEKLIAIIKKKDKKIKKLKARLANDMVGRIELRE